MTISTLATRALFNGNNITTDFDVSFQLTLESDLSVLLTNTSSGVLRGISPGDTVVQTLGVDYSVSLENGGETGATVSFASAPEFGLRVTITRVIPLLQLINYTPNDPFPAETHEEALDRGVLIAQQLQAQLDRTFSINVSEVATPNLTLPAESNFQDAFLLFDSNSNLTTIPAGAFGVASWNGLGGVVNVTTSDLPEGSNLYYTTARAASDAPVQLDENNVFQNNVNGSQQTIKGGFPNLFLFEDDTTNNNALVGVRDSGDYVVRSVDDDGVSGVQTVWKTNLATGIHDAKSARITNVGTPSLAADAASKQYVDALTTDDVAEGTDLYYTPERARDDVGAALTGGTAISVSPNDSADTITVAFNGDTGDVPEGTNLYYTSARASSDAPVQSVVGKTGTVLVSPSDLEQQGAGANDFLLWNGSQWTPSTTDNLATTTKNNVFDSGVEGGQQTIKGSFPNLFLFEDDNNNGNARLEVRDNGAYTVRSVDDDGVTNPVTRWSTDLSNGIHDAKSARIMNVGSPINNGDAATKGYVEDWSGQDLSNKSYVLVNLSSNQSISNNTFVKVQYDSEQTDRNNDFSTTNNEFTAPEAGIYFIAPFVHLSTNLTNSSTNQSQAVRIVVNGTAVKRVAEQSVSPGGSPGFQIGSGTPVELNSGDKVTIEVFSAGTSADVNAANTLTHLTIARMLL